MDLVLDFCKKNRPFWCGRNRRWDETSQTLALLKGVAISNSSWQVMMQKKRILIIWRDPEIKPLSMRFVTPPVPLINADGPSIYNGLERHPSVLKFNKFWSELMTLSEFTDDLHESDGASSNDKCYARIADLIPESCMEDIVWCNNHTCQLTVVSVAKAFIFVCTE